MALNSINYNLLDDWERWSQQSSKYKPNECKYKWHSFRKKGCNINTLDRYVHKSKKGIF